MEYILIILSIFVGIGIYYAFINNGKVKKECKDSIIENLTSNSSSLAKFIFKEIENIDTSTIGTTPENSFYEFFKYDYIETIHRVTAKVFINKEADSIITLTKKELEYFNTCKKELLDVAIVTILNNSEADAKFATVFTSAIAANAEEAAAIEKEQIEYHKTFGNEPSGDPELHPRDTATDTSSDDEIVEKSFEDLLGIGTAEDVED